MTASSTPELDASITLADGRRLAFASWGPAAGRPLVVLYGTPGSRLFCPDLEGTRAAGVRLIAVDRPGYGRSSPMPGLSIQTVADDLAELLGTLRLDAVQILGWSGGGPYAMGFSARYPDLVNQLDVAASWGPLADVPGIWDSLSQQGRELLTLASRDRERARPGVEARCAWYADDPERIVTNLAQTDGPDAAYLEDPAFESAMRTWFREGARQGSVGYVEDWLASYAAPWGFELAEITVPTRIWWGDADPVCSAAHTEYLAGRLTGARVIVLSGEGHHAPIRHWPEILVAGF